MVRNETDSVSRRTALKTAGIALSGLGGAGTVVAKNEMTFENFRKAIETGDKILKQNGLEARKRYLRSKGVSHDYKRSVFRVDSPDFNARRNNGKSNPQKETDGISTQKVDCVDSTDCDGDIDLAISIGRSNEWWYTDMSVRLRYIYDLDCSNKSGCTTTYQGGEAPIDGIALSWQNDTWTLSYEDMDRANPDDEHINWSNGSATGNGTAFEVSDKALCQDSGQTGSSEGWSNRETAGAYIKKAGEYQYGDDIHGVYRHSWSGWGIDGVSIAYPWGISFSGGTAVDSKKCQTDLSGTRLKVSEADV